MLSRKHYVVIAKAIKDNTNTIKSQDGSIDNRTFINKASLINDLSYIFACDNNNFDERRFIEACND